MHRFMFMILAFSLFLIPSPAPADPGFEGCTPKKYKDTAGPFTPIDRVTANISLNMYQNANCGIYAVDFTIKLTGAINTTISCDSRREMLFGVGNTYSCRSSAESLQREFDWMMYGTSERTCGILANWVRDNGGYL